MNIDFNLYSLVYVAAGAVLSGGVLLFYTAKLKKEIKSLKRQYEKKSVGMDDSDLRVKALENKIKTLEAALKKQIGK